MQKRTMVLGTATVVSGGAGTITKVQWRPELTNAFSIVEVPKGQKLVLTDVLYNPQQGSGGHTINIAEQSSEGHSIIFQCQTHPDATQQVHLHTGYPFAPGTTAIAFTDANAPTGKHYSLAFFGYLEDIP